MLQRFHIVTLVLFLFAITPCPRTAADEPLIKVDFDSPEADALIRKGFTRKDEDGKPLDSGGVERALVIRKGQWEAPSVPVEPFGYYRIRCQTKVAETCFVSVTFFNKEDKPHAADVYDLLDASADWHSYESCVRGRVDSIRMRLRFHVAGSPLSVDDIQVEEISSSDVADWADELASRNPVMRYRPPRNRCSLLPNTMKRLRDGGRLRVVILGDSICNDTSNSTFEALLQRVYPQAHVEVVTSVRGSTGCSYYRDQGRVEQYVLRFKPAFVIIGGISHDFDVEAIRAVIRQIRANSDCEIMVMSGPVTPLETIERFAYQRHRGPRAELLRRMELFPDALRNMTHDEKIEHLDMRTAWDEYMLRSYRPQDWFMRDIIHANNRGKQVLGRILARYFEPKP